MCRQYRRFRTQGQPGTLRHSYQLPLHQSRYLRLFPGGGIMGGRSTQLTYDQIPNCKICGRKISKGADDTYKWQRRLVCRITDPPPEGQELTCASLNRRKPHTVRHTLHRKPYSEPPVRKLPTLDEKLAAELQHQQIEINTACANRAMTAESFEAHQWYQSWNR